MNREYWLDMFGQPAQVIYCSASGNDDNDGLTRETPLATLTRAYEKVGTPGAAIFTWLYEDHEESFYRWTAHWQRESG